MIYSVGQTDVIMNSRTSPAVYSMKLACGPIERKTGQAQTAEFATVTGPDKKRAELRLTNPQSAGNHPHPGQDGLPCWPVVRTVR